MAKSSKLRVGFFAQHQLDELVEGDSAYQHIVRLRPEESEKHLRTKLGGAGFNNDIVDMPVEKLSGGQKARLLMLIATIDAPHILILDEPTNHLDIESREALVLALNDYEGAVILVSHDTHLVESVADRLWLVKNGTVTSFDGDMDDYKKFILQQTSSQKPSQSKQVQVKQKKTVAPKKTNPIKLKLLAKELEEKMDMLSSQKSALETQMAKPDFYNNDGSKIAEVTNRLSTVIEQLAETEERWLETLEKLEAC